MKKEHWLYIVIVVLFVWIIASYVTAPKNSYAPAGNSIYEENKTATSTPAVRGANAGVYTNIAPAGNSGNAIAVSNQPAGNMVKIDSVSLAFDGWVVVHESDSTGNPGWALGAQRFDAGTYTLGQVEVLRLTEAGKKYYVMLHKDDGDRMFDIHLDLPYMENGAPVMTTFVAS